MIVIANKYVLINVVLGSFKSFLLADGYKNYVTGRNYCLYIQKKKKKKKQKKKKKKKQEVVVVVIESCCWFYKLSSFCLKFTHGLLQLYQRVQIWLLLFAFCFVSMQTALVLILTLAATVFGASLEDFPDKIEVTFSGEDVNCNGLLASVVVSNAVAEVNAEEIVTAVAESFAEVINEGSAIAAAEATSTKVLEVTAEAVATIDAKVNSPYPGCWAIAFGRAQAVAIASAVVTAIAEGIAQGVGQGVDGSQVAADAFARAEDTQESVAQAVATVALLLVRGDGSGEATGQATAIAQAKAVAINCALAQAYAEVLDGTQAEAAAIVEAGCPVQPAAAIVPASRSTVDPCECVGSSDVTPNNCAAWGGAQNICYVTDPEGCTCAMRSTEFDGQKWRFCRSALEKMQGYLTVDNSTNDIAATPSGYGYCATQLWQNDIEVEMAVPSPPPAPVVVDPVDLGACPFIRCIGSRADCCNLDPSTTPVCNTFARTYSYQGTCQGGLDVWVDSFGFDCVCR
eukprot:TRINITY_DN1632_c0_g1_i2.p1 TRINITY_DN1632_c0_g1~~TRINITY_DN1632_c0_g1_i2.p1  ORF type:complete len:513 (+),score=63.52 TRINITY_DN1632_c0_g1_i2:718-2256(+)